MFSTVIYTNMLFNRPDCDFASQSYSSITQVFTFFLLLPKATDLTHVLLVLSIETRIYIHRKAEAKVVNSGDLHPKKQDVILLKHVLTQGCLLGGLAPVSVHRVDTQ